MNERLTPETDAIEHRLMKDAINHNQGREALVFEFGGFARQLERQRDEALELARELRDALQRASDLLERAGREDGTTWEPGQSWTFREDKCTAKNDVEAIRGMLAKAKGVLP